MKRYYAGLLLAVALLGVFPVRAQEKEESSQSAEKPPVPLTVTLVFSEYEGEKKISSLPYSMPVNAPLRTSFTGMGYKQLRMGVRVPIITTSTKDANVNTVQYMDVGTDIDCRARIVDSTHFEIDVQAERSSIYSVGREGKQVEWSPDEQLGISSQPIIRRYQSTMTLLMRDGQTVQRSVATDPVSGRVIRVEVTVNVVK